MATALAVLHRRRKGKVYVEFCMTQSIGATQRPNILLRLTLPFFFVCDFRSPELLKSAYRGGFTNTMNPLPEPSLRRTKK